MKDFKQFIIENSIPFEEDANLSSKTWLKTGGIARIYITPQTTETLRSLLLYCFEHNIRYVIVGHTSNIYFVDTYNPEVLISTINLRNYTDTPNCIECECGVPVTILSKHAVEKGYIGYSGLVNLPGTVGASICNNSSCFDCSVSEHLIEAEFFNSGTGMVEKLTHSQLGYSHRNSNIKNGSLKGVILSARLTKIQGIATEEKLKAEKATEIRKKTQEPPAFTLGSMYAGLKERQCVRNRIVRIGGGILRRLHLYTSDNNIRLRLLIFGYRDLIPFVSQKTVNTFKWIKDRKDKHEKFLRYTEFINKAYDHPSLEIEVRQ